MRQPTSSGRDRLLEFPMKNAKRETRNAERGSAARDRWRWLAAMLAAQSPIPAPRGTAAPAQVRPATPRVRCCIRLLHDAAHFIAKAIAAGKAQLGRQEDKTTTSTSTRPKAPHGRHLRGGCIYTAGRELRQDAAPRAQRPPDSGITATSATVKPCHISWTWPSWVDKSR